MGTISDFLPAGSRWINVKLVSETFLVDHVLEDKLGHGAAADIAVANE